ncbi:uncharacterized protein LOC114670014 [Macaca mulatta]
MEQSSTKVRECLTGKHQRSLHQQPDIHLDAQCTFLNVWAAKAGHTIYRRLGRSPTAPPHPAPAPRHPPAASHGDPGACVLRPLACQQERSARLGESSVRQVCSPPGSITPAPRLCPRACEL